MLPWPYKEALRLDEANNPLALLATGMYGKALPNQNGAPLKLVVPWKYGFKGIKAIVKIKFTDKMPNTTWNDANPSEYGFYANVNPMVDHPRWSQAKERRIGQFLKIPTLPISYGDAQVLLKALDGPVAPNTQPSRWLPRTTHSSGRSRPFRVAMTL